VFALILWWLANYGFNTFQSNKPKSKKSIISPDESRSIPEFRNNLESSDVLSVYTPPCIIKDSIRPSISAIKRASSYSCKKQIADLACKGLNRKEELYPQYIPNFCPTANKLNLKLAGQYLGKLII
jgi:hypothetical protein